MRKTARHPELLSHEGPLDDQDGVMAGGPVFAVFLRGIDILPSKYLRIELDTGTPTVGALISRVDAVLGSGIKLSCGGKDMLNPRQYLHRLGVSSGGVVDACRPRAALEGDGVHSHGSDDDCPAEASPLKSTRVKRGRLFLPGKMQWLGGSNRRRKLMSTGDFGGRMGLDGSALHEECVEGLIASDAAQTKNAAQGGFMHAA